MGPTGQPLSFTFSAVFNKWHEIFNTLSNVLDVLAQAQVTASLLSTFGIGWAKLYCSIG